MDKKRDIAMSLFKEGYSCSQSVFGAYAEDYGIDRDLAFKLSASFGAGMGRMREVCGAFSGMLLVAGLETGSVIGKDANQKKVNYDLVQELGKKFKELNGSLYCKDLLGLTNKSEFKDTKPEARTDSYYKKRPCLEIVGMACDILDEMLKNLKEEKNV